MADEAWDDLVASINQALDALPSQEQAVVAMCCAQRLVGRAPVQPDLNRALDAGWAAIAGAGVDIASLLGDLESREDLDDHYLAATFYALSAAKDFGAGSNSNEAAYAVFRLIDDAFERVPYPPVVTGFRPLAVDMATETVQDEIHWLQTLLVQIREVGVTPQFLDKLRK